jgi:hypothetical protein
VFFCTPILIYIYIRNLYEITTFFLSYRRLSKTIHILVNTASTSPRTHVCLLEWAHNSVRARSCLQVTLVSCSRMHQAEYLTRQRRHVVRTVWPLLCTRHAGDCSALPPISGKPTLVSVPLAACLIPNLAQYCGFFVSKNTALINTARQEIDITLSSTGWRHLLQHGKAAQGHSDATAQLTHTHIDSPCSAAPKTHVVLADGH